MSLRGAKPRNNLTWKVIPSEARNLGEIASAAPRNDTACRIATHPLGARNGNNVQKVLVIFISGTDANTIESKLGDDVAPDLGAVGTVVSVERSILREHWSIWQLTDCRDNGTCQARQTGAYCGLA